MLKFRVNDFISLKLENDKTEIYVLGEKFIQCKFLLINIPIESYDSLGEGTSIDSTEDNFDHSLELSKTSNYNIPLEVEFWAHCSNLQIWAENKYNTKLLHRSIAFPLLRKLTEVGDHIARRAFKEEIAVRLEGGDLKVTLFLIEEGYLNYLSREELEMFFYKSNPKLKKNIQMVLKNNKNMKKIALLVLKELTELGDRSAKEESIELFQKNLKRGNIDEYELLVVQDYYKYLDRETMLFTLLEDNDAEVILELDRLIEKRWIDFKSKLDYETDSFLPEDLTLKPSYLIYELGEEREFYSFLIENRRVIDIYFRSGSDFELIEFPKPLLRLTALKKLDLSFNNIPELPENISKLKDLIDLALANNHRITSLPNSIGSLKLLGNLDLTANGLTHLPKSIGELRLLKELRLDNNKLTYLPEEIGELESLEYLSLFYNNLKELPRSFGNLKKLHQLIITGNKFTSLPETILDISSLKFVNVDESQKKIEVIQKLKEKGVLIGTL